MVTFQQLLWILSSDLSKVTLLQMSSRRHLRESGVPDVMDASQACLTLTKVVVSRFQVVSVIIFAGEQFDSSTVPDQICYTCPRTSDPQLLLIERSLNS